MEVCVFSKNEEGIYTCVNCGGHKGQYQYCPSGEDNEAQGDSSVQQVSSTPIFFADGKECWSFCCESCNESFQSVPANVKEERISICQGCEHYNSATTRCNECGCFINIKADWASEKCPIDKWDMWTSGQSGGCGGCGKK